MAAIGCTVALAACGSSSSHHAGGASGATGEAGKPPAQILADAAAALRSASGYVMQGHLTQSGELEHVRIVAANRSLELALSGDAGSFSVIIVPAGAYLRVDEAFLKSHGANAAGIKPNQWLQVPPAVAQNLSSQLGQFSPHVIARCLAEGHGTLSVAGTTVVSGQKAVILRDAGNVPGDGPGTLAVAATGTPYPLQVRQTGPKRPGGRVDVCNDGRGENSRSEFTLSQFGAPPSITAPSNAAQTGQQSGEV